MSEYLTILRLERVVNVYELGKFRKGLTKGFKS